MSLRRAAADDQPHAIRIRSATSTSSPTTRARVGRSTPRSATAWASDRRTARSCSAAPDGPRRSSMLDVAHCGRGSGRIDRRACVLARAGARVLIVDRETFPRDKLCGDTLNPGAVALAGSRSDLCGRPARDRAGRCRHAADRPDRTRAKARYRRRSSPAARSRAATSTRGCSTRRSPPARDSKRADRARPARRQLACGDRSCAAWCWRDAGSLADDCACPPP